MEIKKEKKIELIKKLRNDLKYLLDSSPEVNTVWYMEKFLISRDYDYEKTKIKFENFLKWRKKKNLERILDKDFKPLLEILNRGMYNMDKEGRPVIINRVGKFNPEKFLSEFKFEDLEDFLIKKYEQLFFIIFPICSKIMNKKIDKVIIIMDLEGIQLKKVFNSDFRGVLKKITKATSAYFPETLGKIYILNAPFYFRFIWKVIQYWIDEKTRERFEIFSDGAEETLKEIIDERDLPDFFGGKSKIKLSDQPGPWKEYILESEKKKCIFLDDLKKCEMKYFYTKEERKIYRERIKKQAEVKVVKKNEEKEIKNIIKEDEKDPMVFESLRQSEIHKIDEILNKIE